MELIEWLDKLGYEEAWIGEHHSAAFEIIGAPEVFIAAAIERTRNIRLGTGVSSLAYHHPLMLAERINLLDHLSRGRVMFGVGPGALVSDAFMMGIQPAEIRDRMDEALEVLIPLMRGEAVTHKASWFELNNARIHMDPYSRPSVEFAVANQVSPSGARAAGKNGVHVLSIGATSAGGFNALASNWAIAEEQAKLHGHKMDRNGWRLVGPMHIAETREQALAEIRFGMGKWIHYFQRIANLPLISPDAEDPVQDMVDTGFAVIGTPEDAIKRLEQLVEKSGGFGCFLLLANNWANWDATKRSYDMFQRYVVPHFQGLNIARNASINWVQQNKPEFNAKSQAAIGARIAQHIQESGTKNIAPEILQAMGMQDAAKAKANGRAKPKAAAKGKAGAKANGRAPVKANGKAPVKANGKAPAKGVAKARASAKAPAKAKPRARVAARAR
jgi:limonene 1,2-monooxygenase